MPILRVLIKARTTVDVVYFACFESVLQRATEGPAAVVRARSARQTFAERGGAFEDKDPWYEERTLAFLDWFVMDFRDDEGRTLPEAELVRGRANLGALERQHLEALCRSMRGLFRVDALETRPGGPSGRPSVLVTELRGNAAFSVRPPEEVAAFAPGDIFDGHIVPYSSDLFLSRGLIFHPGEATVAIERLVPAALAAGQTREAVLWELLRMRMRFDHYRGIRAEKIYRFPFTGFP